MKRKRMAVRVVGVLLVVLGGCSTIAGLDNEYEQESPFPSGGGGGGGGAGGGPSCLTREDCPPDSDCVTWACASGACVQTTAPDGTPTAADSALGDCKKNVCQGGDVAALPDDFDIVPDNDPCTVEMCSGGVKQAGPSPDGTACGETGKLACVNGLCEGCNNDPNNCNAPTECQTVECQTYTCVYSTQVGKVLDDSSDTDCQMVVCDAQGNQATVGDTTEMPQQLGDDCKIEVCAADGSIAQITANEGMQCAPSIGDCYDSSKCVAGTCTPQPTPAGTRFGDDGTPNNCKATYCDGMGMKVVQADPTDLPIDPVPSDCAAYVCVGDVPTMMTKQTGAGCGMGGKCCGTNCCAVTGTDYCDGNGACCASGKACNGACCQSGTASCINSQCCETATVCSNICCPTSHSCNSTGACCPIKSQCPNGSCCDFGETCNSSNVCIP
jgi:hypothetical protein